MKSYTVGLIFDKSLSRIALMEKTHPEWQKGKLNGIGGKVEKEESDLECLVREIEEETSLQTKPEAWTQFASMIGEDWQVNFYVTAYDGPEESVKTVTDEKVGWYSANDLPSKVITDLIWLVPLALDKLKNNKFKMVEIKV